MTAQATEAKTELYETKKELKISLFHHKAEMRKMSDLMRAKDKDNAETIRHLQAEIASLKVVSNGDPIPGSKKRNQVVPGTSLSNSLVAARSSRKEKTKKTGSSKVSQPMIPARNKTTRANFGGRKSPSSSTGTPSTGAPDDDLWGHDGFFAMHGSSLPNSPPPIGESKYLSRKQSYKQKNSRAKKSLPRDSMKSKNNSNLRVVSPDSSQTVSRNFSTSSLKEALNKKSTNDVSIRRSSLAAAASKKSSLASKANM